MKRELTKREEDLIDKLMAEPWEPADWQDLHEAMENVRRKIAKRHLARHLEQESKNETPVL